jgi:hypothetical protein
MTRLHREVGMHKRFLITFAIALVAAVAIPVQAALAKPVDRETIALEYVQPSVPLVSERSAAMNPPVAWSASLVSERSAAMNPPLTWSAPLVSEKLPGLHQPLSAPSTIEFTSTGSGFSWGDAGVVTAAIFAAMLIALAGAAAMRHYHGRPAH